MNKSHKSEPYTKRQKILLSSVGLGVMVAGVGCLGDQAHAMGSKALHNRVERTNRLVLNEELDVWSHNLESEGIFPEKYTTHTRSTDGRHLVTYFRAYTGGKGHRHLRLKLKLNVAIVSAVVEEEEFLYEDGSGFIYYDTTHSGSVDVKHVWRYPSR